MEQQHRPSPPPGPPKQPGPPTAPHCPAAEKPRATHPATQRPQAVVLAAPPGEVSSGSVKRRTPRAPLPPAAPHASPPLLDQRCGDGAAVRAAATLSCSCRHHEHWRRSLNTEATRLGSHKKRSPHDTGQRVLVQKRLVVVVVVVQMIKETRRVCPGSRLYAN